MPEQPSLIPRSPEEARRQCLGNLAGILGFIAAMNRAETGQSHNADLRVARKQSNLFISLRGKIPEAFRRARGWAQKQYSQLGAAMCEGCLGRDACPFRTYDTDQNPQVPHINPGSDDPHILAGLEAWYSALKPSARNNIRAGKITPVTIRQSHNGAYGAHKAAA